ncbi:MAG: hypothetical protein ACI4D4_01380 [Lachnospira sp.]
MAKKNIAKKIVTSLFVATLFLSMGVVCYANNYYDTFFDFHLDFQRDKVYDYTELRNKEDDTSSYIYYVWGDYEFTASVVAGDDGEYLDDDAIRRVDRVIVPGYAYYLINYVKEDGDHAQAAIRAETDYYYTEYDAQGYWSPDSI